MQVHEVIIYVAMLIVILVTELVGVLTILEATDTRTLIKRAVIMTVASITLAAVTILLVVSFDW